MSTTPGEPTYLVAVNAPLKEPLSYLPPEKGTTLSRGQSVTVPLGKRKASGVVLGPNLVKNEKFKMKPMINLDDQRPLLSSAYMNWLEWLSSYYLYPIGQIFETVFPPLKREGARGSRKSPAVNDELPQSEPPKLTEEQSEVLRSLKADKNFGVHLLHGVTGSGKTEVYLHMLEEILASGKQGLVLVPEISLTPQLIDRFSRRFKGSVAVLHSHLTEREKTNHWWSMVEGQRQILIGARSALFCPLPNLGLIILDEEHEPSYKQDEKLKYHARDAAIVLAKNLNVPIILGSATPSLESWNNVKSGKFKLHTMSQRVNARPLPEIEVVDLREQHRHRKDNPSPLPFWLSDRLHEELQAVWQRGDQAALFLNRRGLAQTAQCHACGHVSECPNCSVSLTVHANSHLVCHYCDYNERLPETCPDCKQSELEPLGMGTERVEQDIQKLFPEVRIARADRDEIQTREQLEKLIEDVEQHRVDLLIGTQMIAKGLDFAKLNLVGLVLADVGFHWPDFRASERSYQLLTQVSGRSGRQTAGKVVIQTYDPEHPSIKFTLGSSYNAFADYELQERSDMLYPPVWRMAMIRIQGQSEDEAERAAQLVVHRARMLQKQVPVYADNLVALGPAPAPLFRLRNKFRFQVMLKCDSSKRLNAFCRQLFSKDEWIPAGTKVQVDIDPFQML